MACFSEKHAHATSFSLFVFVYALPIFFSTETPFVRLSTFRYKQLLFKFAVEFLFCATLLRCWLDRMSHRVDTGRLKISSFSAIESIHPDSSGVLCMRSDGGRGGTLPGTWPKRKTFNFRPTKPGRKSHRVLEEPVTISRARTSIASRVGTRRTDIVSGQIRSKEKSRTVPLNKLIVTCTRSVFNV